MPPTLSQPAAPLTAAKLRMRPDLVCRPVSFGARRYWVVKDPVAMRYFHLQPEEYELLTMLDGRTAPAALRHAINRKLAPRELSAEALHAFLVRLHQGGLVLAETGGQGAALDTRQREQIGQRRRFAWLQILALRFRGCDPQPFIEWLYPRCRWLLSPWPLLAGIVLVLGALLLLFSRWQMFLDRLPAATAFFSAENLLWVGVSLAVVKILHELGHALAARHFGTPCHEIGLMLLVFVPCLYCNVSDTWLLPNRWRRAAVAAAGIYVELVIAAACTFLWWTSTPGPVNMLLLGAMFVCSVSTVLFNGNPLMRYDGYYILSDLVGIPNLAQRSRQALLEPLARLTLGMRLFSGRLFPERRRGLLVGYAVASLVYRVLVLTAILWMIVQVLAWYRLEVLAHMVLGIVVLGVVGMPLFGLVRFFSDPARRRQVRTLRAAVAGGLSVAAFAFVCLVPLPARISAPVVVEPTDAALHYVAVPGTLEEILVDPGQQVDRGTPLARLASFELEHELLGLEADVVKQRRFVQNLELQRRGDQLPEAREALADLRRRLSDRRKDEQRLTLTAAVSGTVMPPPAKHEPEDSEAALRTWEGSTLAEENLSAYLETGTLFCLVGDPGHLQPVLVVDQNDVDLVQPGQQVRLALEHQPGRVLAGTVLEIERREMEIAPATLAASGRLATGAKPTGPPRPATPVYRARIALNKPAPHLLLQARGRAKIQVAPATLGARVLRFLRQTFAF